MIKALSSLKLSLAALAILIIWLWIGAALAGVQSYLQDFNRMNYLPFHQWFTDQPAIDPVILAWVIGLFVFTGLLITNQACCTFTRLVPNGTGRLWRRRLIFVLHILMVAVMVAHGASFFMGHKAFNLKMGAGASHQLPGGITLKVDRVVYVADKAYLKMNYRQARRAMSRKTFSREDNFAVISFHKDSQRIGGGEVRYFHPVNVDGLRAHLVGFFVKNGEVGVKINAARSPLWPFFSVAYALLIAAYVALMLIDIKSVRRSVNQPAPTSV